MTANLLGTAGDGELPISWGEEVLPGVHLLRRAHNPHAELARRAHDAMMTGAPVELSMNYEKIHTDIDAIKDLIQRLEESNQFMEEYLKEQQQTVAEKGEHEESKEAVPAVGLDDDEVVRDALKENKSIIISKRKELQDLLELTRLHYCSHSHPHPHSGGDCNHHHHHDAADDEEEAVRENNRSHQEQQPTENDVADNDEDDDEASYGDDDDGGPLDDVTCMADLNTQGGANAPTNTQPVRQSYAI